MFRIFLAVLVFATLFVLAWCFVPRLPDGAVLGAGAVVIAAVLMLARLQKTTQ